MGGGSALAEKDLAGRSLGGYRIENVRPVRPAR
jgi:hypothetical protein